MMCLKISDSEYLNSEVSIQEWNVNAIRLNGSSVVLATYTTEENAQAALDRFMTEQGYETVGD